MSEETSRKILTIIEKNKIKMKPVGYFWFCRAFWLTLAAAFFFLSVFWAGVFFYQLSALRGFYFLDKNPNLFLLSFPYLPAGLLIFFISLALIAYRRGRMVCHHENWLLFFLLSLAGFSSGALWLEWSRQGDTSGLFFRQGQVLDYVLFSPEDFWLMPEKGTLKGEFVSFDPETGQLLLFSQNGEQWKVETKGCSCQHKIPTQKGVRLQIFGEQESQEENIFRAQQLWKDDWEENAERDQ